MEHKKLTKDDINLPKYCLFFIRKIQEAIEGVILNYENFICVDIDSTYPYCSDAFNLITKMFERKGVQVMVPTFKLEMAHGIKIYHYKWKLRKAIDTDDLPF